MSVRPPPPDGFAFTCDTLIIGAGAGGLVSALAASGNNEDIVILEADAAPSGSTALSAGLIPAPGTAAQKAAGIEDDADIFAADIMAKAKGENDPDLVATLAEGAGAVIDWLADSHGLPFSVVDDFDYPGHSRRRMHGLPTRSGRELIDRLRNTVEDRGIPIITRCRAETLFADEAGRIHGVETLRPDGTRDAMGCNRLILACNGFGGNKAMVREHMPTISDALYFGHDGNRGDAVRWGEALGAATRHLGAFQGHGNVAHPHGILITWATIMEGGIQVNAAGSRFHDESAGYSEAAAMVLAQPNGIAWAIYDTRIAGIARQFADFREAEAQGAVITADSVVALAEATGLPDTTLGDTLENLHEACPFGRRFDPAKRLAPPYAATRVTGALFHTQGGLEVDGDARVRRIDSGTLPNLFAVGGAACGVSGSGDAGYLSGNGLVSAVVLGYQAGRAVPG